MQWWSPAGERLPATEKFLLFEFDQGGLNNMRMSWEMNGLVAQFTNRTLVLPPAAPLYCLDFGLCLSTKIQSTKTKMEDLINTRQLMANLPTLTSEEFAQVSGLTWGEAKGKAAQVDPEKVDHCSRPSTFKYEAATYLLTSRARREGFDCAKWFDSGGPKDSLRELTGTAGYALLTHGFIFHEDAFRIAAVVIHYLGIFSYSALHARYQDFRVQYADFLLPPDVLYEKLRPWLQTASTLYLATDEPRVFQNFSIAFPGVRLIMWEELVKNSTGHVLKSLKSEFSEERWFKLTAIAEMLICAFAESFVGTKLSTFSGHIRTMRFHARAPVTKAHHITDEIDVISMREDIRRWREDPRPFAPLPNEKGDPYRLL